MVEMALTWNHHTQSMLCDLIERVHNLSEEHQKDVWRLIEVWATTASDGEKATVREKIRVSALSERAARRAKKKGQPLHFAPYAKATYDALEPQDIINRNLWLFKNGWVEESAEEMGEFDRADFQTRDARIEQLRVEALKNIHSARGLTGLLELASAGGAPGVVGWLCAKQVLDPDELTKLLQLAFESVKADADSSSALRTLISNGLHAVNDNANRTRLIGKISEDLSEVDRAALLLMAPYRNATWQLVGELAESAQTVYWNGVAPDWVYDAPVENKESIDRLLKAGRPRAAFFSVHHYLESVDPLDLHRILSAVIAGGSEKEDEYRLDQYYIEEAFKRLNESKAFAVEQLALLEIPFLDALRHSGGPVAAYGAPNLNRYLEEHPEFYVQAIVWGYKRSDDGIDPPEFRVQPESVKNRAHLGHAILDAMQRIPGHDDLGVLETARLAKWISTVRSKCEELSRGSIGDLVVGKLLAAAPAGRDEIWPCEAVRDVMEDIQSDSMMQGARSAAFNARGVHWRGEGGDQERALADRYRSWEKALRITHPFVASELLGAMARGYEHDATDEDTSASLRRRLR